MSQKLFYKPAAIYAHCGSGNHKQNLILHCSEMVLEERPVIMVWFVKSVGMFQQCQMLISPTGLTIY
jgi:hypothetical protein